MSRMSDPGAKVKTKYELFITWETDRAWQVIKDKRKRETAEGFWLPKSVCDFEDAGNGWGIFAVPKWLADEKGLDPSLDGYDDPEGGEVIE